MVVSLVTTRVSLDDASDRDEIITKGLGNDIASLAGACRYLCATGDDHEVFYQRNRHSADHDRSWHEAVVLIRPTSTADPSGPAARGLAAPYRLDSLVANRQLNSRLRSVADMRELTQTSQVASQPSATPQNRDTTLG